jgi:hypothetical protein
VNRIKSITALLDKVKKGFVVLTKDYDNSLNQKEISEELKIDIKNIFENLRSCLDYLAHDIHEACINGNPPKLLYFPIKQSKGEFDSCINKDFINLNINFPDIYFILESVQPYNDSWLTKFNKLNNNNKHQDLVEQTRIEQKHVTVSSKSGGGSVSWGPGVTFGSGVSVMGVSIDSHTQMPVPNTIVNTEVITWVDFKFKENGESVIPFIKTSINKIENIFIQLSKHI